MEISSEGNITLPLVGKIQVAGKKPIEAEKEISLILDRDYLDCKASYPCASQLSKGCQILR